MYGKLNVALGNLSLLGMNAEPLGNSGARVSMPNVHATRGMTTVAATPLPILS
jgi:hypothetical protein